MKEKCERESALHENISYNMKLSSIYLYFKKQLSIFPQYLARQSANLNQMESQLVEKPERPQLFLCQTGGRF